MTRSDWAIISLAVGLLMNGLGDCSRDARLDELERRQCTAPSVGMGNHRATYTSDGAGPPGRLAETGAGDSLGSPGFGPRITPGWRFR